MQAADRLGVEDLSSNDRYALIETVEHAKLVEAVQAHAKRPSSVKTMYMCINGIVIAALAGTWLASGISFLEGFPNLCLGMGLGYLVLMPIHELIHAWTYRRFGARETRVVYNWRNLTAYCTADRFVVNGREFVWICLMPFVVLNSLILAVIFAVGGFVPLLWGMLLLHVSACSGDAAFVNLAWAHRETGLWTYDDSASASTYFYVPRSVS
jgi:hypothetical protein